MYSYLPDHRSTSSAMNAPLLPEVLLGLGPVAQTSLDLAAEGVQRYVWQSAFGVMLIEVRDGRAFVNGQRVLSVAELSRAPVLAAGAAQRPHPAVHQCGHGPVQEPVHGR